MYQNNVQMYAGFVAVFICMCAMGIVHHSHSIAVGSPVRKYSTVNATLRLFMLPTRNERNETLYKPPVVQARVTNTK